MKYDFLYVLGDSFAYNTDVQPQELFASLIAEHYNLPLVNKGIGGVGNNYIFRKAYKDCFDVHKGTPLVILVYTAYQRDEVFVNTMNQPLIINTCPSEFSEDFSKTYFSDHYNEPYLLRESLIKIKATQTLLDSKNIDRIECFSLMGKDHWGKDVASVLEQVKIDETCLMDETLTKRVNDYSFIEKSPEGYPFVGHPTVEGNKMIADWIIKKIESLYGNNL